MEAVGVPVGLSDLHPGWPTRARIRYGTDMARWLRSRRGRRARLKVSVVTVVGSHQAMITRVTLFGAVLHGGRRLKRCEIVALRLPSGWRVKGRVRWRLGAQCGITFCNPVAGIRPHSLRGRGRESARKAQAGADHHGSFSNAVP